MKGLERKERWREGWRGNWNECVTVSFKAGRPTKLGVARQAFKPTGKVNKPQGQWQGAVYDHSIILIPNVNTLPETLCVRLAAMHRPKCSFFFSNKADIPSKSSGNPPDKRPCQEGSVDKLREPSETNTTGGNSHLTDSLRRQHDGWFFSLLLLLLPFPSSRPTHVDNR